MKFSMMKVFLVSAAVLAVVAYSALPAVAEELDNLLEKPRIYVGSDNCKSCHLAQYYSWRKRKLKVPADQIYVPKPEEIKYTIGSKWKQRFIVDKEGTLFISPVQYNSDTDKFVNYHEADWDKRPWLLKCGGCHTTGVNLEKQTFSEPAVGCEACHGKGSWHFASPTTEFYKGQPAIVNPAKLTKGVAVQICGSCHNRGKATKQKSTGKNPHIKRKG
jgi:hypothetical protein